MSFNSLSRSGYKPLTLADLDRMPGPHHTSREKEKPQKVKKRGIEDVSSQPSTDEKVETYAKKQKSKRKDTSYIKHKKCTECHKRYRVTFRNAASAKADYVCKKCLKINNTAIKK